MNDWILVGMMGSGKSSVGKHVAEMSSRKFRDTDTLLQNRFGRPITKIFELYGEETFRAHETSILQSLEPEGSVLATGGGIVLREENWTELRRLGLTIYLQVPVQIIIDRMKISRKKRPLLDFDDWEERVHRILEAREHLYQKADVIWQVDTSNIQTTAQNLVEHLNTLP
ncbi:MAG: shikimate kinase [Armatimonadetes bacterium]|nr:shikimate kinase [Armatimonadota bacterium]